MNSDRVYDDVCDEANRIVNDYEIRLWQEYAANDSDIDHYGWFGEKK